jgi:hypothetical protein
MVNVSHLSYDQIANFFTILALLTGEGIGFLTLNIAVSGFLKKEVFDV